MVGMSEEQVVKVRSDLLLTQQNMAVFSEMLTELTPGKEHPQDKSLFDELYVTCRSMQTRLVELIDQVDDDQLTAELLEVNDDMNNLFLRYDRYEKNKGQSQGAIRRTPAGPPAPRPVSEVPLIDFSGSEAEPTSLPLPSLVKIKDEDMANVADWIGDKDVVEGLEGGTTSEFDRFLAERAAAPEPSRKSD
ncbi:TOM1-like protein 2 [Eurytemora carolleeae]|uniref:TOM1-like protein 2 n=1 Tax=Eurytemora carolleeae TaxID=1294199 RepID=UPI000C786A08|nr:TOM1-like protein 2 [Eurytemora carolleeae]XP_023324408.1 TOM1-like protein 2 [Eurytemora carolleeae]XP_023324410.1 TOM1-like protein 2 [Eurytemora carolleeae]XP_023324411.1 TOM1-like protein 2 [Eurytemora carolleeae]|eukprot:XP_023324407.1 TOM1-like protein 2 [Eurytemora affinis]